MAATSDGFALSRFDLSQRREGDVLGAAQSGRARTLRLLSVLDDEELVLAARRCAEQVVDADPTLGDHPVLAEAVRRVEDAELADFLEKS